MTAGTFHEQNKKVWAARAVRELILLMERPRFFYAAPLAMRRPSFRSCVVPAPSVSSSCRAYT